MHVLKFSLVLVRQDVIGAAETGSGKTLAFGLPILQRLLDEREKAENQLMEKGEADEKVAPSALLRALIITPTRELALQVRVTALVFALFILCWVLNHKHQLICSFLSFLIVISWVYLEMS